MLWSSLTSPHQSRLLSEHPIHEKSVKINLLVSHIFKKSTLQHNLVFSTCKRLSIALIVYTICLYSDKHDGEYH